ncbi:MAG: type III pantothenate kinase [Alistipes sp.]|nr:type III pantothenate kinase [Alistipes sp.]
MNLLVEIGNTRMKWALADADGRVFGEEVGTLTDAHLASLVVRYDVQRAICSSTRGEVAQTEALLARHVPQVVSFTADTPVPVGIDYATPETLGRDRVAAAVGASVLYPNRDVLIVDFGTALTMDYLSADGVFHGGSISLGVTNRFRALHEYTASLPLVEPTEEEQLFGNSTKTAIAQGVMNSVQFELEGYIARMAEKKADFCIIFTGGEAKYFVKRIKNTIFAEPNLVFCGLNRILEYNATTKQ